MNNNFSDNMKANWGVQYIRTDGYVSGAGYPIITVISSKRELDQYYEKYKDIYYLSSGRFLDAIEKYTDGFFANRFIVFVILEEGSGSIRHTVENVEENGNIIISRSLPQIGTMDMAQWHIVIEFDNSFKPDKFSVAFYEIILP